MKINDNDVNLIYDFINENSVYTLKITWNKTFLCYIWNVLK